MARRKLSFDFETWSELDLLKVGTDVYAQHESTEILMCAYSFDDEEEKIWVPAEGEECPDELWNAWIQGDINTPEYGDKNGLDEDGNGFIYSAWNKPFEWHMLKHILGIEIPHTFWRDPMIIAMTLSLPGKLSRAGDIVGIAEDKKKQARGTALITRFCKPRKPTKNKPQTRETHLTSPVEWEEFKGYCINDVKAEKAIDEKIRKYQMPAHEWTLWVLDQKINQAGIPIDQPMVENAVLTYEYIKEDRMTRMRDLTGLANPNSGKQLLPWLKEWGYPFDDLKKGHVERAVERCDELSTDNFDDPVMLENLDTLQQVLKLRLEANAASPKKFHKLQMATAQDGLLRNCFQFAGAQRTWRWAGRLFQPQNLPRPDKQFEKHIISHAENVRDLAPQDIELIYDDPMGLLKSTIRPAAKAPDGKVFIDADLNAIENRVLGWIADDRKILEVFEQNQDPYIAFAQYMYHENYEDLIAEYKAGNGMKRTVAKPGVLGCGYMLSAGEEKENKKTGEIEATGLLGYAWNMGVKLTHEEAATSVAVFRETFADVKKFWYDIENAAKRCLDTKKTQHFRMFEFDIHGPFMRIRLPSGRYLWYCRPKLENKMMPWGKRKTTITYEGLNTTGQWVRQQTHPGKITENVDQAISRDLLANGMLLANKEGLDIRLHVHDQIVCLSDEDKAERELKILQDCMGVVPTWADGLPLASAGFISKRFMKD